MRVAFNFPTAYVRVASQTYVLQHILPLLTVGAINLEKALVLFLEYTTSNFAKIRFPALEAAWRSSPLAPH